MINNSSVAVQLEDTELPPPLPIGPVTPEWVGSNRVPNDLKNEWTEQGYSILRGAYSRDEIEEYNRIVAQVRTEYDTGEDEFGYGDRIGQLHQRHPELLKLASAPAVTEFLRWAFNDDPVVFGSLNFARGTEQEAHIDAIFFWPEPTYSMAGCWVALEDISVEAGPLFYVPHSHKWPFYLSEHVVANDPELARRRREAAAPDFPEIERRKLVAELGSAWTQRFLSLEAAMGTERTILSLKAGDVVFWHSVLAHGGSARLNRALSRKSAVFHFIGRNTKLYTFDQFMLLDRSALESESPQPMDLLSYNGQIDYMRYDHFVTYNPDETINPIQR
jgi:ectoine hydroxylase-related dioxygenase (phytanoyl-CoA dioxygenase family)